MRDREKYDKRVGTVVDGRWRVDSLLGWGATSAVYAATHRNGHRAALKILHQSLCADASTIERFLREAGIANAIKHRAIVPIRDDGTSEDGCAYLVVELLEGETLEALRERRKGRIELEELAPIAEELMSAISAVHAAGVIHRDLKPQNVFLTGTGELKLLDFGSARIFDRADGSNVSAVGMVLGTPAFMSPEQARGARAEVDARSDVWSLGAMIFTILSGEYVHVGRDAQARLLAAASKHARKLGDVAPSVDDRIAIVVDRALAFAKEDRWPDVQSMRIAFWHAVVAAVPTMRDLDVFEDVAAEEAMAGGAASMSEREIPAAETIDATVANPTPVDSPIPAPMDEIAAVSSTQGARRVKAGIPVPALVIGFAAMAAAVLLVVFFKTGGDEPPARTTGSPSEAMVTAPSLSPSPAVPAASFILIEAPDERVVEAEKHPPPAWATAPVSTTKAALATPAAILSATPAETASATAPTDAARAIEGAGAAISDVPDPKGGPAPAAAEER